MLSALRLTCFSLIKLYGMLHMFNLTTSMKIMIFMLLFTHGSLYIGASVIFAPLNFDGLTKTSFSEDVAVPYFPFSVDVCLPLLPVPTNYPLILLGTFIMDKS